jgi:subtilisin family serine protease
MRRIATGLTLVVAVAAAAGAATPGAAPAATIPVPYVVVYDSAVVSSVPLETQLLSQQLGFTPAFEYSTALKGFAAALTSSQLFALQANPAVSYVELDLPVAAAAGTVALASGETVPPGVRRIGAASTTTVHASSGVGVAVIDTGIDLANSDLNAVSGTNCIKPRTSAQDDNGHGTNVAGILGARNQGAGVVGVAPGTRLYAVKVLDRSAKGSLSQLLCGIDWVAANASNLNIKVANLSFAGSGANDGACGSANQDAEHQAICGLTSDGVTVVAAAGNSGADFANEIPAAYPEVLTVTAMTDTDGLPGGLGPAAPCTKGQKDDTEATYSSFAGSAGEAAHTLAAPGTCVVSDGLGGGTSTYIGTSQAAPHVAGTVALCLNDGGTPGPCGGLTPAQVLTKVRGDAAAHASTSNGFAGDPLRPISRTYYGYLIDASAY